LIVRRTFALPDLGEGLEEATVDAWLVAEGDVVELNQPIAEIETAKATVEVPSPYAGRVATIHAAPGATLSVGDALVTIEVQAAEEDHDERAPEPRPDEPAVVLVNETAVRHAGPPPASPATRALARRLGVDLSALIGSGPEGRITRDDVERAASGAPAPTLWAATVDQGTEERPLTQLQRRAAERLTRAAAVPTVTTWRTLECSALQRVREDARTSPLPFVVRALADVCRRHPLLNATWTDDAILVHARVHVGIATDTDRGLVVPVVHDADRLGVRAIADRIAELAAAARDGSIEPARLVGHTITVTNTGSYGSEAGTPLLNPPDAVIVALGAIEPRALVVDGSVVARPACTLSVTFDHRVLDGAATGRALNDLVPLLQDEDALRSLPA
jgi:2-oxoisovalerate dehydrogenase E2 component (dihydrolipoyl transacylase)